MANFFVRGDIIWADFYVDGKRYRRSTRLENTPQNRKYAERELLPRLQDAIRTGDIFKGKAKDFNHYYGIFLKSKESLRSFSQKKTYFNRVLEHFDGRDVRHITRLDVKQYLASLNMKPASKMVFKSALKEILDLALDNDVITTNPAADIKNEPRETDVDFFSEDEVALIMSKSTGWMKAYLSIAFYTGLRPSEILGLQLGDISDTHISMRRTRSRYGIGHGKSKNARRSVPYPSFIKDEIMSLKSKSIFMFGDIDDPYKVRKVWDATLKELGLRHRKLYCTRHTYATTMLRRNVVSINELAGLLGHSSPQVTLKHYASVIDPGTLKIDREMDIFGTFWTQQQNENA